METKPVVFLVDDNEAVLRALRRIVEAGGSYTTCCFSNPLQAAAEVKAGARPVAAISDCTMPEMDGFQLAAVFMFSGIPILLTSGSPEKADVAVGMELPFLHKPYRPADIRYWLRRVVFGAAGIDNSDLNALLDEATKESLHRAPPPGQEA